MRNRAKKPADVSQEDWESVDVPEAADAEFATARLFDGQALQGSFSRAIQFMEKAAPGMDKDEMAPKRFGRSQCLICTFRSSWRLN